MLYQVIAQPASARKHCAEDKQIESSPIHSTRHASPARVLSPITTSALIVALWGVVTFTQAAELVAPYVPTVEEDVCLLYTSDAADE